MHNELPVHFAGVRGNAVQLAQKFLADILQDGCVAVDATAGNGNDTLFLASAVGGNGRVYAFDIQRAALDATGKLLQDYALEDRVVLINDGHERLDRYINLPVDAFIFNLGYLPGGDHNRITRPETTRQALHAALGLLKPGGRISIVVYTGHTGAGEESGIIEDWAANLNPELYGALKTSFINRSALAPFLLLIERVVSHR